MKLKILSAIILSSVSLSAFATIDKACNMPYLDYKASDKHKRAFYSQHGVNIVNDTGQRNAYQVHYENNIDTPHNPPFPILMREIVFVLEPGESYQDERQISKDVYMPEKGHFNTIAKTRVYMNGHEVPDACGSRNKLRVH